MLTGPYQWRASSGPSRTGYLRFRTLRSRYTHTVVPQTLTGYQIPVWGAATTQSLFLRTLHKVNLLKVIIDIVQRGRQPEPLRRFLGHQLARSRVPVVLTLQLGTFLARGRRGCHAATPVTTGPTTPITTQQPVRR
uniref:(northern house mosquito) hypothetical protein n=1 Tax=Culex pipiens TaxID=7175 RepID=A0A8D8N6Z2_CULPI